MKVDIGCPHGKYDKRMFIQCEKSGMPCAHQKWCGMKGRSELLEQAKECLERQGGKK